jgi:UDP-N-acetylglucosamine 2-epimerase (non-hydrolysing)
VIGNPINEVMIRHRERIEGSSVLARLGLEAQEYLVLTLHRQETVDFPDRLGPLVDEVVDAASAIDLPVIFSVHPRTRERLDEPMPERMRLCDPFGYFDFVALARSARCVLTDSGTVQEECCIMGVPTVTVRDSTERPETVECGSNVLSGVGRGGVGPALELACAPDRSWEPPPEYLETDVSSTVAATALGPLPPR